MSLQGKRFDYIEDLERKKFSLFLVGGPKCSPMYCSRWEAKEVLRQMYGREDNVNMQHKPRNADKQSELGRG